MVGTKDSYHTVVQPSGHEGNLQFIVLTSDLRSGLWTLLVLHGASILPGNALVSLLFVGARQRNGNLLMCEIHSGGLRF